MPFSISNEMMREIIMDHYQNPRNKKEAGEDYQTIYMDSTSCIDKIYIQIKIENGIIKDCCWHGIGCAISTASTSIMTELVSGKKLEDAQKIIDNYLAMIQEKEYDPDILDEAIVFMNTSKQAARIKCATIGWRGLNQLINPDKKGDDFNV